MPIGGQPGTCTAGGYGGGNGEGKEEGKGSLVVRPREQLA